jgi:transcriptional regulator with XRE-family HTH domain
MTAQELNTLVGENIRYYRNKKYWSQEKLGRQIGASSGRICDYENGRHYPSCPVISLLAFVLGVNVWQLFYDRDKGAGK